MNQIDTTDQAAIINRQAWDSIPIEWQPTLSSIVTAVAQAGLRITHLHEVGDAAAKYGLPGYPLEFLLRAVKG